MRPLCLVLAVATASPALAFDSIDVELADITATDGTKARVDGGCWLSTPRCVTTAQRLAALQAENASLKAGPPVTPAAVAAALLVGIVLGAGAAMAVAVAVR